MAQNDKQNTVVFKSSVPLLLVARVPTQLPELPASISLWEGNDYFLPTGGKPLTVGKHCSHHHFSWRCYVILCFPEAGEKCSLRGRSKISKCSAEFAKHWGQAGSSGMSSCYGFALMHVFPSICHSFAFAVNAVELQAPMMELFFLKYNFRRWNPPKTNSNHLCAEVKILKTYFKPWAHDMETAFYN